MGPTEQSLPRTEEEEARLLDNVRIFFPHSLMLHSIDCVIYLFGPGSSFLSATSIFSQPSILRTQIDTRKVDSDSISVEPFADEQNSKDTSNRSTDIGFDDLTLYEKKAVLVEQEINAQGMGRYQWMIFALCGFGYMLDLLWAQAFGLVVSPLQQELGFHDAQLGNIFTAFSAGLTAGALVWGVLVDVVGRKLAFNLTVLISSVFGLLLGLPSNYFGILVLTAFVGFGVGGNVPIDTTICLEFLPKNKRWLLPTLFVFQPIGVVICSGIAYGLIPFHSCGDAANGDPLKSCRLVSDEQLCCTKASNYGWRYLFFTLGGITLLVFFARFVIFRFQESPKFLLSRGYDEKAIKVLQHIANYNRLTCSISIADFEALEAETSSTDSILDIDKDQTNLPLTQKLSLEFARLSILFEDRTITRLVICVWLIYAFDYWGFTIAGSFLPTILLRKGHELNLSLTDTYRSYIYIHIFGIPGVFLATALYRGRQFAMLISSVLFGACLFILTVVDSEAKYIGVSGLVYFFQSMFNAVLYGWTPESFPAPIRGTATGVASFWGRTFSIISPLIAAQVFETSTDGVLYLAGAGVFLCTLVILLIPRKYLGNHSY